MLFKVAALLLFSAVTPSSSAASQRNIPRVCQDLLMRSLVAAFKDLTITTPDGSNLVLAKDTNSGNQHDGKTVVFIVKNSESGLFAGRITRSVNAARFPFVYDGAASVSITKASQGMGIGLAVYKTLYDLAPVGAKIAISNGNEHSRDALDPVFEYLFASAPFSEAAKLGPQSALNFLNGELTEYARPLASLRKGPLWLNLLYKAGWRNLEVKVSGVSHLPIAFWRGSRFQDYRFIGEKTAP